MTMFYIPGFLHIYIYDKYVYSMLHTYALLCSSQKDRSFLTLADFRFDLGRNSVGDGTLQVLAELLPKFRQNDSGVLDATHRLSRSSAPLPSALDVMRKIVEFVGLSNMVSQSEDIFSA